VIGIGATRVNDPSMRALAHRAKGTYAAADTLAETTRALNAAATPDAPVIGRDVRVQVEFNPLVAGAYRLIGYENGPASTDDVASGDRISAGHMVTALYEVVPAGKPVPGAEVFALKYSKRNGFQAPAEGKSDELLTLKLHYQLPDDGKPVRAEDRNGKLLEFAVKDKGAKYGSASADFKFAAAVAEFALVLRGSEHRGKADLERVARLAAESAGNDKAKIEFADLVRKTISQGR
jgi:Ca-activated chloride channel family protein